MIENFNFVVIDAFLVAGGRGVFFILIIVVNDRFFLKECVMLINRLCILLLLFCSLFFVDFVGGVEVGKRPNIVFVITDDQGYADMSRHGHPVLKTPHLDALAKEGMSFSLFHASPTCAPTRSAIMSGRDPFYVGVTHTILERERMALGVPTLPEMLKKAGYTTGLFGKWHLGDEKAYRPESRGFDEVFMHGAGGIGQRYQGSCGDAPGNKYFGPYILHNGKFEKTQGFCTDVFFDQGLKWIEKQKDAEKPFFAYISTNAPHGPYICADKYKTPFKRAGYNKAQQSYYGMIANIDENMGRLVSRLKDWGLDKNTILVFMSDNGPAGGVNTFNLGMRGKKGSVHEGGTRVPFLVRWPGVVGKGLVCDRLVRHFDLLPTFAEVLGVEPMEKGKLAGRSMLGLLKDPDSAWGDRHLVFHVGRWGKGSAPVKDKRFALRSQRFRYVAPKQLYDMERDPWQKVNVYGDHPEVVNRMESYYDSWWEGAIKMMVNEDAELEGENTFRTLFRKQYGHVNGVKGEVKAYTGG